MTIQTAIITPRRLECLRIEKKLVERVGKIFKHNRTSKIFYPDWDSMKEYPLEALSYFKGRCNADGTCHYMVWDESPEKVQNEFFAKNHITKSNLIKLEDEKCNYDKSIKVTWDDGN